MSQVSNYKFPAGTISGEAVLTQIEDMFGAAGSGNLGASAPSNPFNGMTWIDTSEAPVWTKRIFTSEGWRPLTAVNITTGEVTPYIGDEPAERQSSPTDTTPGRLPALFDIGGGVGAIGGDIIQGGVLRQTVVIPYDLASGDLPSGFTKTNSSTFEWDTTAFPWLKFVRALGGGSGASGGGSLGGSGASAASGGGPGAPFDCIIDAADLLPSETLTLGAPAASPAAGNNNGLDGNTTSLGSHATATGGSGGSGDANGAGDFAVVGGLGGTTTYAATAKPLLPASSNSGRQGGPSLRQNGSARYGGHGGHSPFGAGGHSPAGGGNSNGQDGKGWAAGGSGATSTSASRPGGAGAPGGMVLQLFG